MAPISQLILFSDCSIGYLTIGEPADPLDLYDAVPEIAEDGAWTWGDVRDPLAGNPPKT